MQCSQMVLGKNASSRISIPTPKEHKLRMEICTCLWKQGNNSNKSSLKWDLKKWKLTDMYKAHFGISMLFSSPKLTLLGMHMTHSLLQTQNRRKLKMNNIWMKWRKFMKLVVLEVKAMIMSGILNKQRKIC